MGNTNQGRGVVTFSCWVAGKLLIDVQVWRGWWAEMKSYSLQADGRDPYHVQVKILKCQMNNPLKKKKKTHAALELQATEDGVSSKV